MSFLDNIIKQSGNEYASIVEGGIESDINGFIDTGSYAFNALLSGSIYGGIPDNKILALAGEQATGKTFFSIGVVKAFLDANPDAVVLYFDSEQAVTSDMFKDRGVDPSRIAVFPVDTVENFRQQAFKIIEGIENTDKKDRKPMMVVLDSLGMLPTNKEVNDISDGKNVRDMTRAQLVKSTFRVLTLKLGQVGIPMIMTNHTYDVVGAYVPTKEMSGGSGLKYAASTIVYLSKRKDKDGTDIVGNLIRCKLYKGRLTKENSEVTVQLNYKTGLNKYYGLVDFAVGAGVFEKVSTRIKLPDGKTAFEKQINNDPEKYYTQEVLDKIDEFTRKEFRYGN